MKRHTLWLPLLALTTTILMLAYAARKPDPLQATVEKVRSEARSGDYRLITTEELWGWLQADSNDILLVDTRQEWEYRTGHIRGAVNFPMEPTWLSRWRNKGALTQLIGPDKNRTIVFY
jgi:3-mercaptopyruvate sulfurtransferase SseA